MFIHMYIMYCWPTAGQQTADSRVTDGLWTTDSRLTVGRHIFWGALFHNLIPLEQIPECRSIKYLSFKYFSGLPPCLPKYSIQNYQGPCTDVVPACYITIINTAQLLEK